MRISETFSVNTSDTFGVNRGFAAILILGLVVATFVLAGTFYLKQTNKGPFSIDTLQQTTTTPRAYPSTVLTPIKFKWNIPQETFTSSESESLKAAIAKLSMSIQSSEAENEYINLDSGKIKGDWAVLYGGARLQSPTPGYQPTGISTVVGHKESNGWHLVTANDPSFCQTLQQVPEDIMSSSSKQYYC